MMLHFNSYRPIHLKNAIIATFFIVFIALFLYGSIVKAGESSVYEKSFTSIEITAGDTLYSIAADYSKPGQDLQEYVKEVQSINNLKTTTIHTGCYIVVPVYYEVHERNILS